MSTGFHTEFLLGGGVGEFQPPLYETLISMSGWCQGAGQALHCSSMSVATSMDSTCFNSADHCVQ